jgi:hypothetical protein
MGAASLFDCQLGSEKKISRIRFRYTSCTLNKPQKINYTPFHQHYTVDDVTDWLAFRKRCFVNCLCSLLKFYEVTRCVKIAQKLSVVEKNVIWTPIYTHAPRMNQDMTLLMTSDSSHDPGSAQHRVRDAWLKMRMKNNPSNHQQKVKRVIPYQINQTYTSTLHAGDKENWTYTCTVRNKVSPF